MLTKQPSFSLRPLFFTGICLGIFYFLFLFITLHRDTKDEVFARKIERWSPRTYGFFSALELSRALPSLSQRPLYSPQLAIARIEQVVKAIRPIRITHLVPNDPFHQRAYALFALSLSLIHI